MARRRILVAVLPPRAVSTYVGTLRLQLGDPSPGRIVPHITLVPPMNVPEGGLGAIRRHLRSVALSARPAELRLGAVATFLPSTPTLHFSIVDDSGRRLETLRQSLMSHDLIRDDDRAFNPHLTIRNRMSPEAIRSAMALLAFEPSGSLSESTVVSGAEVFAPWGVGSFVILEQLREEGVGTYWVPLAEETLGEATVVGRGGVELVIRSSGVVEPVARSLLSAERLSRQRLCVDDVSSDLDGSECGDRGEVVCVTAEAPGHPGQPLGVAVGTVQPNGAVLDALVVRPDSRGIGVGHHLLAHWLHAAAATGAQLAWARGGDDSFLAAMGFVNIGAKWVRDLSQ